MGNWETFKLSELRLDQTNYRTGKVASQRAAIGAIIDDQKKKLANLAEDILSMGAVSPGEPIWVTRDLTTQGMYTVLEGNRRVAALKLLETPALADGTVVEQTFATLAKQYAEKPIRELEAWVFASREEAAPWIRRRHMTSGSGVGLQGWGPFAKGRADKDQGLAAPRFLVVHDYLQDDSEEWSELTDVLDAKWTTVDRVLNASAVPALLGVDIDMKSGNIAFENGDVVAGKRLLWKILEAIAAPDFSFELIEKDSDRETFVKRFVGSSVKAPVSVPGTARPGGRAPSTPLPGGGQPATAKPGAGAKAPAAPLTTPKRNTLAPKSGTRTFHVDGPRLNPLYRECREIKVAANENAAAFLLRVFIELSCEAYLVEKSVPIPQAAKKSGKTDWADFGINLATKVREVADHLDASKKAKELQQARVACDPNSSATFSINTLHSYFHNRLMKPDALALMEAWDAWESYLRALHGAR